ncbi:MAG: glutamine synthetase type III [Clostridia bacterium]|nr:glutamine synthetase type III [Clostridia bacterium]NLS86292.1 glutamine synthetase type III [Oscillospiraceae bacterium]
MAKELAEIFGKHLFDDRVMRERLPQGVYESLREIRDNGKSWDPNVADVVADAMKSWAMELGATHYIHWFCPMTGTGSGKHDSFIDGVKDGAPMMRFSGKMLAKGEGDASSFPSGGLRATFEARGYTTWDPTSPAFVLGTTLYIPTAFCSYTGEALDQKTPVLRSMQALNKQTLRVLRALGDNESTHILPTVGAEQEYFLVDKKLFDARLDLKVAGHTLFGAKPPKGQELEDHYYGTIDERVRAFMRELDEELWLLGVPAKTEHNEVAPGQYELASVFATANIACDHNQIMMELMRKVALRHGFACLLHEKPFAGINGSGKHNNWSIGTNTGKNLLDPTDAPEENNEFLVSLCAVITAVDKYADLLRMSASCPGNEERLGGNEAPPAIVSIFLGEALTHTMCELAEGHTLEKEQRGQLMTGVKSLPRFTLDDSDRNRTSPFAFTGNKFEFRMVGSSQSVGLANAVTNAIVADVMHDFADKLENTENIDAVVHEIVTETWREHGRVIFNGNNYSEEWVQEAARRGLPNIPTMAMAAEAFVDEKNVKMFERTHVFTPSECASRHEIMLETYSKHVHIDASTMLTMVRRSLLPACYEYLAQMSNAELLTEQTGAACASAKANIQKLCVTIDEAEGANEALRRSLEILEKKSGTAAEIAAECRKLADKEMCNLRTHIDALELLIPKKFWPIPDYCDLLFDL